MLPRFWRSVLLVTIACAPGLDRPADQSAGDTLVRASVDIAVSISLLDLAASKALPRSTSWTGDYSDLTGDRRFIRALVPLSRTMYCIDGGVQ